MNIEDDIESRNEFWKLLELIPDREKCLGKLILFFRYAQKKFGRGEVMTSEDLSLNGFEAMVKTGWAVPVSGGYKALGADKQFAWYAQRVQAGKTGGRPKAKNQKKSESNEINEVTKPGGTGANRSTDSENPLTPSLALSLTKEKPIPMGGGVFPDGWPFPQENEFHEVIETLAEGLPATAKIALRLAKPAAQMAWLAAYPDAAWIKQELLSCLAHLAVKRPKSHFSTFPSFFGNWLKNNWRDRKKVAATAAHTGDYDYNKIFGKDGGAA